MRPTREIEDLRLKLHLQSLARDAEQRRLNDCLNQLQVFETVSRQLLLAQDQDVYVDARTKLYELAFSSVEGPPMLDLDFTGWGFRDSFGGPPSFALPDTPSRRESMPPSSSRSAFASAGRDLARIPSQDRSFVDHLSSEADDSTGLATCPSESNHSIDEELGDLFPDSPRTVTTITTLSSLRRSLLFVAHKQLGRESSIRRVLRKLF